AQTYRHRARSSGAVSRRTDSSARGARRVGKLSDRCNGERGECKKRCGARDAACLERRSTRAAKRGVVLGKFRLRRTAQRQPTPGKIVVARCADSAFAAERKNHRAAAQRSTLV